MESEEVREKSEQIRIHRDSIIKMDELINHLKSYRAIVIEQMNDLRDELREDYYESEKIRS